MSQPGPAGPHLAQYRLIWSPTGLADVKIHRFPDHEGWRWLRGHVQQLFPRHELWMKLRAGGCTAPDPGPANGKAGT